MHYDHIITIKGRTLLGPWVLINKIEGTPTPVFHHVASGDIVPFHFVAFAKATPQVER